MTLSTIKENEKVSTNVQDYIVHPQLHVCTTTMLYVRTLYAYTHTHCINIHVHTHLHRYTQCLTLANSTQHFKEDDKVEIYLSITIHSEGERCCYGDKVKGKEVAMVNNEGEKLLW